MRKSTVISILATLASFPTIASAFVLHLEHGFGTHNPVVTLGGMQPSSALPEEIDAQTGRYSVQNAFVSTALFHAAGQPWKRFRETPLGYTRRRRDRRTTGHATDRFGVGAGGSERTGYGGLDSNDGGRQYSGALISPRATPEADVSPHGKSQE